jgi:hypothetical protein
LDEALGLPIGFRRIGLGSDVLEPEPLAGSAEGARFIARSVVGHDALNSDAELGVVGHRGFQEGDSAAFAFVFLDLGIGDARGVVDADMDVLPTHAPAVALSSTITGDAMSYVVEPAEFLDVDMDELAGMFTLVTAHRLGRFQRGQPIEAQTPQNATDRGCRDAQFGSDLLASAALTPEAFDLGDDRRRRWPMQPMGPRTAIKQSR